jgi:primosomal protein N' (replication factor Y)
MSLNPQKSKNLELDLGDFSIQGQFASIVPLTGFDKALSYRVSESVSVASLVEIPLGRRRALGVVVALEDSPSFDPKKTKKIYKKIYEQAVLTEDLVALGLWMSKYYACSMGAVFESFIPAAIRQGKGHKKGPMDLNQATS